MSAGLDEFAAFLKEGLATMGPFQVKPFYSPAGDDLFVYLEDVPSYAEILTPEVTVFRAQDDKRIIGVEISGVRAIVS